MLFPNDGRACKGGISFLLFLASAGMVESGLVSHSFESFLSIGYLFASNFGFLDRDDSGVAELTGLTQHSQERGPGRAIQAGDFDGAFSRVASG